MTSSTAVKVSGTDYAVSSVVVFRNRAEVTRRFPVELQAGTNEVEIKDLPSSLDAESIRVRGMGKSVTVLDVIHKPPPTQLFGSSLFGATAKAKENDTVAALRATKSELEGQRRVLDHQAETLVHYSKTLSAEHISPDNFLSFMEKFVEEGDKNMSGIKEKERQIREIEEQIKKELETPITEDDQAHKRRASVTVVIQAQENIKAELSLTYVVRDAKWNPTYDIRATTDVSGSPSNSITLHHRASITQSTGEDWRNASLTLSTAQPEFGSTIPTLLGLKVKPTPNAQLQQQQQQQQAKANVAVAPNSFGPTTAFNNNASTFTVGPPQVFGFGSSANNSTGLFGQQAQQTSTGGLFGQPTQQATSGGLFGQTQQPTTSAFGQPAPSLFGQAPQSTGFSAFGGPVGASSLFGSAALVQAPPPPPAAAHPVDDGTNSLNVEASQPGVGSNTEASGESATESSEQPFDYATATIADTSVAATYTIEGKTTIPSDGATHKVAISLATTLTADISLVTVPRLKSAAFLQALVKNTTTYPLIPGQATIFYDDSYIGSTHIHHVPPKGYFYCSFGLDHNVRVSFSHVQEKLPASTFKFAPNTEIVRCTNKVVIHNDRRTAIPKLVIEDAIPSATEPFKVVLESPEKLAKESSVGSVEVEENVTAVWKGAMDGRMEWILKDVDKGERKEVNLIWTVESPAGTKWTQGRA